MFERIGGCSSPSCFDLKFFFLFLFLGSSQSCQDIAWEKVSGARPEYTISKVALFSGEDAHGIVIPCFERYNTSFFINFHMILYLIVIRFRCKRINCTAFVIDIERSLCYSVEVEGDEFVPESNSIFYQEVCIKGINNVFLPHVR